jgi:kynurenine 3-monooxygenase
MFPFLGQGLNAGLEDVACLVERLDARRGDWAGALEEYQQIRKPNCDAVTELAAMHYAELAVDARDPAFVLRKRVEARITALLPDELPSPYHVVSFSDKPYADAQRLAKIHRRIVESALRLRGLEERWGTEELDTELRDTALKALSGRRRVLKQRRAAKSAR